MAIKILSENVINKIAAGEVIARPVCVVRELIDNALDSGASEIDVYINFTNDLSITVVDNGGGISERDLPLACMRHHTSKITSEKEIFLTSTRGFRGEALAAIAAVSHMEITSSTTSDGLGSVAVLKGGNLEKLEKCNATKGTKVGVSRLFFNTPVREKFLRSLTYEASLVKLEIMAYVLACSGVQFRYFVQSGNARRAQKENGNIQRGGSLVLNVPAFFTLKEKICRFFPQLSAKGSLIEIDAEWEMFQVKGLVSSHSVRHTSHGQHYLFMRRKRVETPVFIRAVREAYKHILPTKIMPLVFISLTSTDPLTIDFNVHPAKKTVALQNTQTFFRAIYHPIRLALRKNMNSASLLQRGGSNENTEIENVDGSAEKPLNFLSSLQNKSFSGEELLAKPSLVNEKNSEDNNFLLRADKPIDSRHAISRLDATSEEITSGNAADEERKFLEGERNLSGNKQQSMNAEQAQSEHTGLSQQNNTLRGVPRNFQGKNGEVPTTLGEGKQCLVLGQIAKLYIVFTFDSELFIMDQHAAHERANYDKIWAGVNRGVLEKEAMVIPLVLTSDEETVDKLLLPEIKNCFGTLGFEYEAIGNVEIAFSHFPSLLAQRARLRVAKELLVAAGGLVNDANFRDLKSFREDFLRETVARIACRSSVMSGDELSLLQMEEMVNHVVLNNYQITCPHGRPFVHHISLAKLDSFFERSRHIIKK